MLQFSLYKLARFYKYFINLSSGGMYLTMYCDYKYNKLWSHNYVTVISENNYSKIDKVPQIMSILSLLI